MVGWVGGGGVGGEEVVGVVRSVCVCVCGGVVCEWGVMCVV